MVKTTDIREISDASYSGSAGGGLRKIGVIPWLLEEKHTRRRSLQMRLEVQLQVFVLNSSSGLKNMLKSSKDALKLESIKRLVTMIAKEASETVSDRSSYQ